VGLHDFIDDRKTESGTLTAAGSATPETIEDALAIFRGNSPDHDLRR
jgi:hypothetical protein